MQTQLAYHNPETGEFHIVTVDATPMPSDEDSGWMVPWLDFDNVAADPPLPIETLNSILEDRYDELCERFID